MPLSSIHASPNGVEQLLARGFHRAVAVDVHVQGRRGNAEALRQVLCLGVALCHGAHRHAQHGHVHLARPAAEATPGAGRRQAGAGAFDDQFALEFGQRREDAEDQAAVGGAGVDLGAGAGEHAQADTAGAQFVHGRHQMFSGRVRGGPASRRRRCCPAAAP